MLGRSRALDPTEQIEAVADAGPPAAYVLDPPGVSEYRDIVVLREKVRGQVARGLLALLAGVAILAIVLVVARAVTAAEAKDLVELLFTPLVGVFGAVTGFYYSGDWRGSPRR